ncbi:MAG TPA: ACP S-malonyltransferase [Micropepsaceae bacterium]|nr:ACP S-malonyltransferase [Micropepsaceae bacterium]
MRWTEPGFKGLQTEAILRAFIFPGQGSQAVGMGKILAEAFAPAREAFEEVDDALSQRLSRLMWEGPESDLLLTENAQPAIMTASMAIVRVLQSEAGLDLARHARVVAGHSLGEYTALCAAGAFSLADTARLVRLRGQAMQAASPVGVGTMAALIGIDIEGAEAAVKEAADAGIVVVANDNAPGQIVISGEKAAVDKAGEIAKTKGAKRVIPLNVSTANHSPLLKPAGERMREALADITIRPPSVPVVANVTASEVAEPDSIRRLLAEQVTARVRWRETVAGFTALGVTATVETGGNKVLTGMVKRIDKDIQTITLDSPADIEAFAKTL